MTVLGTLFGCSQSAVRSNSLEPQGPAANQIADLWWLMLALGTITFLVVMALLAWGLWRRQRNEITTFQIAKSRSQKLIIGGGIIFPVIILTIVFGSTLKTLSGLNSIQQNDALVVEVIGHQWWWEINYPDQGFTTANEIHIPVGEPVQFELKTADVIHSFWVPSLHGKRDSIPGQTNVIWLEADEAGQYQGLCAEFCGIQHAKMLFVIVAEPQADFEEWLAAQQETAVIPADELAEQGFLVFMDQGCNDCHTVRGTAADGELGPDLTHFASRLTLASSAYPNNREYLTEWIVNPHDLKEGNFMPATSLSEQELEALLAYLELLQ